MKPEPQVFFYTLHIPKIIFGVSHSLSVIDSPYLIVFGYRKSNSSEIDKTVPTKEDCSISHDKQSSISPTTECAHKIINLCMNCQVSKPLKLNRDCLLHDSKQNNSVTKSKIINCARQSKVSETTKHECSKVSDSSHFPKGFIVLLSFVRLKRLFSKGFIVLFPFGKLKRRSVINNLLLFNCLFA
jgi:hypothetical protein